MGFIDPTSDKHGKTKQTNKSAQHDFNGTRLPFDSVRFCEASKRPDGITKSLCAVSMIAQEKGFYQAPLSLAHSVGEGEQPKYIR